MGKRSVRINTNPVAQRYADPGESIIEISAGTAGAGGLLSLRFDEETGLIHLHIYRHERTVVSVGPSSAGELASSPAAGAGVVQGGGDSATSFFYEHAPTSHNPAEETEEEGRMRGARDLANAEEIARREGWSFGWETDDVTSADHSDESDPYPLWVGSLRLDEDDEVSVIDIGGVDFGRDNTPDSDESKNYRRVVEAQLALEYLSGNGITEARRDAFNALTSGQYDNFVLVHTTYDGVPTAAIATTVRDPYVGDDVEIHPIAVFVTPSMFARLTPPDEGLLSAND